MCGIARIATTAGAAVSLTRSRRVRRCESSSRARTSSRVGHPGVRALRPIGVSFVSPSDGWVLGVKLTGREHIELVKTTDGGRRWTSVLSDS